MKDKPATKWDIKAWMLSDSKSGYIYKNLIHSGKGDDKKTSKGLGDMVVWGLLQGFEYIGVEVYMDNFYTNPDLLMYLHEWEIYAYGTTKKKKREYPKL